MAEEAESGPLPAFEPRVRPKRRSQIVEGPKRRPERGGGGEMLTKPMPATKAMNAVRVGLIVTSWAFVVLGFMLMYSA